MVITLVILPENVLQGDDKLTINLWTLMSDQDNNNIISSRKVMRIKKYTIYGIISWSNNKFSTLTPQELNGKR